MSVRLLVIHSKTLRHYLGPMIVLGFYKLDTDQFSFFFFFLSNKPIQTFFFLNELFTFNENADKTRAWAVKTRGCLPHMNL